MQKKAYQQNAESQTLDLLGSGQINSQTLDFFHAVQKR